MADFQYFIEQPRPGQKTLSPEEVAERGLSYVFGDLKPVCCNTQRGPMQTDNGGLVLCRSTDRIGYYPDKQTWRAMLDNPAEGERRGG